MKTITDSVRNKIKNDEVAREAARRGILNSSAYAREILDHVEEETWKNVEETSITVAVNRISQNEVLPSMKPELELDKISVETGLVDVTFERTSSLREILNKVVPQLRAEFSGDMYIESTGQHQVTMILSQRMWEKLKKNIAQKPIGIYENLVALSIFFDKKYLTIPNFIYAVLNILALDNINLIEIVSTMTEIILVIQSDDMELALAGMKKYLR